MLLTRNFAVLLVALVGVSSAAVDRRDGVSRVRHLAAAAVHRDLGDLIHNLGQLIGTDTDSLSSSTSDTATDPTPTTTDIDTTSTSLTQDEPTQDPTTDPATTQAPPTASDSETTTTTTTTTSESTTETDAACTPVVLLGITIPCDQPTDSLSTDPTQTTDQSIPTDEPTTTPPPETTTTTTDGPESTEPAACTPQVLLGVTVSACDESSTSASEPTISSTSGVNTGTDEPTTTDGPTGTDEPTGTSEPTTTITDSPTTTEPPVECTPEVLLGVTVSACESTTAGPGPDPTTTTTSDTATNTQDPCDPSLLDPVLGGVLPGFCNPTTSNSGTGTGTSDSVSHTPTGTQDTTSGTSDPTGTTDPTTTDPGTSTEPTTTSGGNDPTSVPDDTTTTTTTQTLDPNPTDLFPTGSDTNGEPTWSTTIGDPNTDVPTFTVPDFVTATSSLIVDTDLPTIVPNPTVTDPDAVPVETTPEGQQGVPTPGTTQLPGGLPAFIMSSNAPKSVPPGMTLVTLMLTEQLNWQWVAGDKDLPLQLLMFTPAIIINALKLDQSQVPMLALEAWIPQNWDRNTKNLRTLLEFYMPSDRVDELQHQLMVPTSLFYTSQPNPITKTIVMYVDPTYPLTASSGSNDANSPTGSRAGGNLGGLLGNDAEDDKDSARKRAIIGVCAAIGGVLLLGAIWWGYKNHQLKREQAHRRLSQNSDTQFAGAGGGGAYGAADYGGAGGMQERGRRDSFFFAVDSLRGYEDGRFDDSETFDHRSMAPTTGGALSARTGHAQGGHGHGQPIQPGAISAPILRENTLNW